jgi:hypothetical protein
LPPALHTEEVALPLNSPHDCTALLPELSRNGEGTVNNLHAPSKVVFLIALALVVLALIGYFVTVPFVTQYSFWLAVLGYVVLALGCIV